MNDMPYRYLPFSSSSARTVGSGFGRFMARLLGVAMWLSVAAIGLVFAFGLLIWLLVMLMFSLLRSIFTGRPAAAAVLWRQYRDLTRQRWPGARTGSATPRADATDAAARTSAQTARVQDVAWRDVTETEHDARRDTHAPHS